MRPIGGQQLNNALRCDGLRDAMIEIELAARLLIGVGGDGDYMGNGATLGTARLFVPGAQRIATHCAHKTGARGRDERQARVAGISNRSMRSSFRGGQ